MGLDFIRSEKKPFVKSWKDGLNRLKTRTLFDFEVRAPRRTVTFTCDGDGNAPRAGEQLVVQVADGVLLLCRGLEILARHDGAPAAMLATIDAAGGVVLGAVERVGTFGNTCEVAVE